MWWIARFHSWSFAKTTSRTRMRTSPGTMTTQVSVSEGGSMALGRALAPRSGAHPFGGPGGFGIAGDWGGRRTHGLLAPAGGMPLPPLQAARRTTTSLEETRPKLSFPTSTVGSAVREHSATISPVVGSTTHSSTPAASPTSGSASTAVDSATLIETPAEPTSLATTAVGSGAFGATPPSGRAALHIQRSPC